MRAKIYQSPTPSDALTDRKAYVSLSLSNRITSSDAKLKSIFEWTSKKVASFDVVIGDYYHRHNLQDLEGLAESTANSLALAEGREIYSRVRGILDELGLRQTTARLVSEICTKPMFKQRLVAIEALYRSHSSFSHLIEDAAKTFLQRFAPTRINDRVALEHSYAYQFEELATFEILVSEGYTVNLYPGGHLPVMKAVVKGNLTGVLPMLEDMILIEIRTGVDK